MVKRYHDPGDWMQSPTGEFVNFTDYDALAARLAEAVRLLKDGYPANTILERIADSADAPCKHEWRPYAFHPLGGPAAYGCETRKGAIRVKMEARLAEAERLLRSVASVGYEENGTLFADIDAFLGTADSASPRESERG